MLRILLLIAFGVSLSLPAFMGDFFVAHDLLFHLNWVKVFSEQFWGGDFYPRWLASMNGGMGSPVFFFYGPVPFFISSLFAPFLKNDPYGWLQLGITFSLAFVLSGICAYLWIRKIADPWSAFLAAALYMVLPYHLMVDLYCRLSLAEFWTFVWMPLILYATNQIVCEKGKGILRLSFSYTLLIMTHPPTTLIFSVIPPIYSWTISDKDKKISNCLKVLTAMTIGAGLSTIYLLPALFSQENINTSVMYLGSWKYDQNFLKFNFSAVGLREFHEYVFQSTIFVAILALISYMSYYKSLREKSNERKFWFIIILISLFFMFPVSKVVWEKIPVIQRIQFPWRFNLLVSIATPLIVAISLAHERKGSFTNRPIVHLMFAVMLPILTFNASNTLQSLLSRSIEEDNQLTILRTLEYRIDAPEYFPRWVPDSLNKWFDDIKSDPNIIRVNGETVNTDGIHVLKSKPRHVEISIDHPSAMSLTVGQFYYPGWTATLQENEKLLPVGSSKDGLLEIWVPSGRHTVSLKLEPGLEERLGQCISLISLILCFLLYIYRARKTIAPK